MVVLAVFLGRWVNREEEEGFVGEVHGEMEGLTGGVHREFVGCMRERRSWGRRGSWRGS